MHPEVSCQSDLLLVQMQLKVNGKGQDLKKGNNFVLTVVFYIIGPFVGII